MNVFVIYPYPRKTPALLERHFIDRSLVLHDGKLMADADIDVLHCSGGTLLGLLRDTTGYDEQRAAQLFL